MIEGPDDTPYVGGRFILQMLLPPDYPMKPPSLIMLTPTGRFAVGEKICTTFTDVSARNVLQG
jgi:ubiquitin-protein ligase